MYESIQATLHQILVYIGDYVREVIREEQLPFFHPSDILNDGCLIQIAFAFIIDVP